MPTITTGRPVMQSTSLTGGTGGLGVLLIWILQQQGIVMPPEVAAAAVGTLMAVVQFFINRRVEQQVHGPRIATYSPTEVEELTALRQEVVTLRRQLREAKDASA